VLRPTLQARTTEPSVASKVWHSVPSLSLAGDAFISTHSVHPQATHSPKMSYEATDRVASRAVDPSTTGSSLCTLFVAMCLLLYGGLAACLSS